MSRKPRSPRRYSVSPTAPPGPSDRGCGCAGRCRDHRTRISHEPKRRININGGTGRLYTVFRGKSEYTECNLDLKRAVALRERRQLRRTANICFVMLASGKPRHLKYKNTPAFGFRAAAALAPLEKCGRTAPSRHKSAARAGTSSGCGIIPRVSGSEIHRPPPLISSP